MYPYDEKMLRNEVIYLHSLWHQGPPPDPNLNNPNPSPSSSRIPYVPNPIPFYYRSYYPLCHQEMPNPNPNPRSYYPLCHQQTPNPNHRSNYPLYHQQTTISNPRPKPCIRNSLQPTNPTSFKKENTSTTTTGKKRLREKRIKKKKNKKMPQPDPPPDLGPEWPCPKPLEPAPEASGWPALKPISTPKSLSADERACFAAIQIQCKAAKACSEFFVKRAHTNEDEDEVEDNSEDDGDDEMSEEGSDENEEFKFFFMMFMEDSELRSYFEKNYETGDFCCLVCRGIGKKVWRRYKGCVGLVQHSIAISKTKRKRAHRAFGQVVCKVLGWDFCRFPTIILKDEPLSRSLAKPVELQGDPEGNDDDNKDDSVVLKENVVSANDGSGEMQSLSMVRGMKMFSINGSSENAASVNDNNGENAVYVNASIGEHVVSVSGDNGDDKEVCHVHQDS